MFKKVFIDANIFIDMNDKSRKTYTDSLLLLDYLVKRNIEICTSCDLITTIYYILAKKDKNKALQDIQKINTICKVIEFSNKEINTTCNLMLNNDNFKDLEDTLQYVLAQKIGCELIFSNDKNFYSPEIELIDSSSFCEKYIK